MFYNKSESEWRIQGVRSKIPQHIAKKTMTFCQECNCQGFPYCLNRIYPKTRISIKTAFQDKICLKCGCSACPSRRDQRWNECRGCREHFLSGGHCRCHSWWVMDSVPFYLPSFRTRVYEGDYDDDLKRECDTCQAKLFPYNKREPCNYEKHYDSHAHFDEKQITKKMAWQNLTFAIHAIRSKIFSAAIAD